MNYRERVAQAVARRRAEQGLPRYVCDEATLRRISKRLRPQEAQTAERRSG